MKNILAGTLAVLAAVTVSGCAYLPGGTDLGQVARDTGLRNITTGDGTFENYTATGHYTATEIGIGVGIPFLVKLVELYPAQTNEDLLKSTAEEARKDGADALINVTPAKSLYTGIPFFIVGLYIDSNEATGIVKK